MRLSKSSKVLLKSQVGFTLIELAASIAISGILGTGVVMSLAQIANVNGVGNARITAVKQVENAIYYLNRDVQMAQTVIPQGASGFPLTLTWMTWGTPTATPPVPPTTIQVVYSVDNNGALRRNDGTTNRAVAQLITADNVTINTDVSLNPPKTWYTIQITTTAHSGTKQDSETRKIDIIPRTS